MAAHVGQLITLKQYFSIPLDLRMTTQCTHPVQQHQGQAGSSSWLTALSGPPGRCFTEKCIHKKLLIRLKVTAWISFLESADIRGKLKAVPGGQHHLDPREAILQKSLLKHKVAYRVESDSLDRFLEVPKHKGQAGSCSWGIAPSAPPESCFTEKILLLEVTY